MSPMIQMTTEQLRQLVESIRIPSDGSVTPISTKSKGSFSTCKSRFDGQRDHEVVDEFITSIVTFKEIESISDEDALHGVSLLFQGIASTWWKGVRKEVNSWHDVLRLIREHFAPAKGAYQIYMEIFKEKQKDDVAIDTFICQKRAIMAQLPEQRHDEETEIDFIYGLLNIKYRQHMKRNECKTFRDLLESGRIIELNIKRSTPMPWQVIQKKDIVKKCTFCYCRGHSYGECHKRTAAAEAAAKKSKV
ncbi:activity-regulated cytoskeleton associated protein 2-like [Cochliomyia hominivorax]